MTLDTRGNRPESPVEERTQLLAPVGHDGDTTQILGRFRERPEPWPTSVVHDDLLLALRDVAARDGGQRLVGEAFDLAEQRQAARHAQQRADWDRGEDPLPCGKKIRAIGLLFGAGVLAGAVLGFLVAVVLFALAVS